MVIVPRINLRSCRNRRKPTFLATAAVSRGRHRWTSYRTMVAWRAGLLLIKRPASELQLFPIHFLFFVAKYKYVIELFSLLSIHNGLSRKLNCLGGQKWPTCLSRTHIKGKWLHRSWLYWIVGQRFGSSIGRLLPTHSMAYYSGPARWSIVKRTLTFILYLLLAIRSGTIFL